MGQGMPERLQAARFGLAKARPYLATALWNLVPVATEACMAPVIRPEDWRPGRRRVRLERVVWVPTMSTDKWWRLYFHPAVAEMFEVAELARMLYHEVCHLLRNHSRAAEEMQADPLVANLAQDLAINEDLRRDEGFHPPGALLPDAFGLPAGLSWQQYYELLPKPDREDQDLLFLPDVPVGAQDQQRPDRQPAGPGRGFCGSSAHGRRMPWEAPGPEEATVGSRPIPAGRSAVEGELVRRAVAQEILVYQRQAGTVPGNWVRWAEEVTAGVRLDWRRLLAAQVRRHLAASQGRMDYTFARPNRRQSAYFPAILPGMQAPRPEIAVVIDTSGSMTPTDLGYALAAVADLLRAVAAEAGVRVLSCDAAASEARRVFSARAVELIGGGGTDMGRGIEAACALKPQPDVVVVITDGVTPWPDEPPAVPVTVVLVGDGDGQAPDWARAVRIPMQHQARSA